MKQSIEQKIEELVAIIINAGTPSDSQMKEVRAFRGRNRTINT